MLVGVALIVLVMSACGDNDEENANDDPQNNDGAVPENDSATESDAPDDIMVALNDADGDEVAEATLTSADDEVEVTLTGDGLPKEEAELAFHVHEKGVCEPDDFESAGGHYNPTDKSHGKESEDAQHAGDFDNIEVDAEGHVDVTFTTDQISLDEEAENTVLTEDGTSLVIHEGADDYKSQPSGDAGDRMACGVIVEAE